MKNYEQRGDIMTFTAPGGGVVSGNAYKIGQLLVVAVADANAGDQFAGVAVGVHELPKNNTQALTEGALVYWDDTGKQVTTTATGNLLIGCAAEAATTGATEGKVRLNGIARVDG